MGELVAYSDDSRESLLLLSFDVFTLSCNASKLTSICSAIVRLLNRSYPILGYRDRLIILVPVEKSLYTIQQQRLQILLRQIRLDAGLRQADLALRIGEPQSFVSKYEIGERRLDILEIRAICEAVGITLQEFAQRLDHVLADERE